MAQQTPIVFLGSAPDFSGITQLKTADTLAGIVNHADFGNDAIMKSNDSGTVAALAVGTNEFVGNTGSGIAAIPLATLKTALAVVTTLSTVTDVELDSIADGEILTWSNGDSEWQNSVLNMSLLADTDMVSEAPASGDRLEYNGTNWVPVAPREQLLIDSERTTSVSAVKSTLHPVNVASVPAGVNPPASPSAGDYFVVSDSRANSATNNITVNFTSLSQPLYAAAQNDTIATDGATVTYRYIDATVGWVRQ